MTPAPLHLRGERLMLDPEGAVFWPAARLLAVADLHLEKGTAAARRGQLLPPWDTRLTLDRLAVLLRRWSPATVVALGDSFHDNAGPARMAHADATRLSAMAAAVPFVWVSGNHDPAPTGLPGIACAEWRSGPLVFRHQAMPGAGDLSKGELSGHFHPKAAVETRAGRISRPCFVADAKRIVLPSLGAYTGGLDVTAPVLAGLFPRGGRAFLLGRERLFSFALAPGRATARILGERGPGSGPLRP